MNKQAFLLLACLLLAPLVRAERIKLLPAGDPTIVAGEDKESDPTEPTVDIYLAPKDKANGTAVVVLPGGGYGGLAMAHEGQQIAEFFNANGVGAFVTRYRHAKRYQHPIPMQDAQRAIRYVRANAAKFGVKPDRIGVMGFSAGGHLAATVSTQFSTVDGISSRPDFSILCYPVISFIEFTHVGSRSNLLGKDPDPALVKRMSAELSVTKETPPAFLFHTDADSGVPSENSVLYYRALRQNKIPAEMHIFRTGKHGVGLAKSDPLLSGWSDLLITWMKGCGLLSS
jgi:acetyl esterase/lipase